MSTYLQSILVICLWMRKTWKRRLIFLKSALEVYVDEDEDVTVDDGTIDWQMKQNDDDDDLNSFSCVGSDTIIATIFGVGKSTSYNAIILVVIAMELVLLKKTVYLGDCRKLSYLCTLLVATCTFPLPLQVMAGFEVMGFPQVIIAVDGCHCNIISSVHQGDQFINRKQRYSMLLQGTCDHTGRFIDLVMGWVGSYHDSFFLWTSSIYSALTVGVYEGSDSLRVTNRTTFVS
ncbi:hypothetical protein JD844_004514 [Phrynosoma platyrhinos]|uniref:DDE Tnp4 domain-containing protein n=1 Tax=Phrynosoma platyrhinos TaxID=52577 RepID=A0ABQ7TNP9_PHRPL|nr:hypothetical protein JD844_004514 [Phrynosoma platyrhinos]